MASKIFQWHFTILNHTNMIHSHIRGLFLLLIFFSLLFLITALFLCAHWVYSHCLLSTAAAMANATPPGSSLGLDPNAINNLPIILHTKGEETECCICLGVFEDEEMVKVLPQCNHVYHSQCVDKWLGSQSSCPLCRACLNPFTSPLLTRTRL
ncbi:hypothetical protein E1A91_A03G041200v1 [Gossypium mustelinum]|uniref:RING-type E3 ubiquitin transferase n=1 Tax=Gossypium mustelinum TaxID=34275 RepID=A0A5D2ZVB0_GOSMU|nr:hypothetical protein E1A91_A03G041200v1 [Gossypium mustelinum]